MEYEVEFELNRNTLEFQGELHPNNMQANLILKFTPEKLSQLVNDTGFITASALIPLENDIVEIENDILGLQNSKVDKVTGKGLSTNDFTNALKTKLEGIEAGAEVNKVNSVNGQTGDVVIEIPDSATWGNITGTLSNQTDLQTALNGKQAQLTQTQLNAVNSGITSGDVTLIGTALQPNDNITQLANNAGYITNSALTPLQNDISDINSLIPTQATSSNQLADKSFVNSSIATNTANFIGTFNSVAELEAYSGTLTNNDYAFVRTTDIAGNTLYDRYKWNGTEWLFEYELNNSSFTAQQWAAINSGITSDLVGDIQTAIQPEDLATVATTGDYDDLLNKPTIPIVNDATLTITQGGTTKGTFTANASSNTTIALDAGNTYTAGTGLKLSNNDTEFNIMQQDISAEAVNVVGTLTENNNVYSGFTGSNYLEIPSTLTLNPTDSFEIQFKFYQNSGNTNNRYILSGKDTTANRNFSIYRFNNYCYVNMPYGTGNPNSFNPQSSSVASGQWIWVKVTRTINSANFTMQAFVSTDGTNWTRFGNNTVSGTPYILTNMPLLLGSGATSTTYLNGSIDLNECYIKVNGNIWWSGQGQTAKSVAKATTSLYGLVKPDGTSITVNNGVISANIPTYTAGTGLDLTNDEFSIVQTNSTTSNFSVVGSPTITDGVASNFSDSNYLKFDYPLDTTMTSFEIVTAFKITTLGISNQALIDTGNMGGDTTKPTAFRLTITSSNQLLFRTSTDGNQNYVVNITGSTTLSANTKYWVKVTYSSTSGYVMSLSTNGTTWTSEATSSLTSRPYYYANNLCYIGDNIATGYSFSGSIYLNDTYVKVNGSTVWTPYTIGGVAMATDSLYGLVKPDGNTISVNNGVISGFSGNYNDLSNKPYAMVIEDFTA